MSPLSTEIVVKAADPEPNADHARIVRTAALAVAVLLFASPNILRSLHVPAPSYPLLTVVFTALLTTIAITWRATPLESNDRGALVPLAAAMAGIVAGCILMWAMYRWTRAVVWQRTQADMLIVIREATRRFLAGRNPYATYRTYDAPWSMVLPYGPGLWGPFLIPQLLRVDLRCLTIIGQSFVPLWCGVAAAAASVRGRFVESGIWLAVLISLVAAFDYSGFALLGHTPVYWPLFPALAVAMSTRRWVAAAAIVGVLVVARSTMVSLVPVLLLTIWQQERKRLLHAIVALAVPIATALLPFIVWNAHAIWDGMVLSYPRVMKTAVWASARQGAVDTIGITGPLLGRYLDAFVVPTQILTMMAAYAAAWIAIARGSYPLGWMGIALLAFSMSTLWPVDYLYYDVLLLLVSGAVVEALNHGRLRITARLSAATLALLALIVAACVRVLASPFPVIVTGEVASERPLRAGFDRPERDGARRFSWVVGTEASVVIPRSSASAADIVLTVASPLDAPHPPQVVTAVLNGQLLGQAAVDAEWRDIRFRAPRPVWWIGFNELQLTMATSVSPRELGAGSDRRQLSLAVTKVAVVPQVPYNQPSE